MSVLTTQMSSLENAWLQKLVYQRLAFKLGFPIGEPNGVVKKNFVINDEEHLRLLSILGQQRLRRDYKDSTTILCILPLHRQCLSLIRIGKITTLVFDLLLVIGISSFNIETLKVLDDLNWNLENRVPIKNSKTWEQYLYNYIRVTLTISRQLHLLAFQETIININSRAWYFVSIKDRLSGIALVVKITLQLLQSIWISP